MTKKGFKRSLKERIKQRQRRKLYKAQGICMCCGKRPARLGRVKCEYCWQQALAWKKKNRKRQAFLDRIDEKIRLALAKGL